MHTRTILQPCKTDRRSGSRPRARARLAAPAAATFAASLSLGAMSTALANPTGGVVVTGQGSISTPDAGMTVIDQASSHLQLNWNSFDVGAAESVQFNQPSSSAVALNRILDQNPSQIFGRIEGNGQVVLVNPNGLLIGRAAQLNVSSLVVSSLDAIDFDAASGRYRFATSRNEPGAIRNEGSITAGPGGSVTLLGGLVSNTGSIVADFGTVNLAAGRAATLDLAGDGLLRLEVGSELLANGSGATAAVENSGILQANGGQVLLTARAVQDVFANLVNNSGVVRANRIDNSGGAITLLGAEGTVISSGTLDASAGDAVSSGGTVQVLGDRVGLFDHAMVDVSGSTGGGTAYIGGADHGANPDVLNASRTYVSPNATIDADAGAQGDGGHVVVWSDHGTLYEGHITARGGSLWGNGGWAEVSGRDSLRFHGSANLTAPHGAWGTLLLDPLDITIDDSFTMPPGFTDPGGTVGPVDYLAGDDSGASVTFGAQKISDLLDTAGDVYLQATRDIIQNSDATIQASTGNSLRLDAGRDLTLNGSVILNGGSLQLEGGNSVFAAGIQGASSVDIFAGIGGIDVTSTNGAFVIGFINSPGLVELAALGSSGSFVSAPGGKIFADELQLTATGAIGGAGFPNQLRTAVNTLSATSTLGSIFILEDDAVTLEKVRTNGAAASLQILANSGTMTVGDVRSLNRVTLDADSLVNDGSTSTFIGADGVDLRADSIGTSVNPLDIRVNSLHDVEATTGSVYLHQDQGALRVESVIAQNTIDLTTETNAGNIIDDSNDATGLVAPTINLTAHGGAALGTASNTLDTSATSSVNATTGSGSIALRAMTGENLRVGTISSAGVVDLIAGPANSIVNDFGNTTTKIAAGFLRLTAGQSAGAQGVGNALDTQAGALGATVGGNLYVAQTGNLQIEQVTSGGTVEIRSTAAIRDLSGASEIFADTLNLTAGTSIGTAGDGLNTRVDQLSATANNGDLLISEADGLTLGALQALGASHDIEVTSATNDIHIGQAITTSGDITLATTGRITDDNLTNAVLTAGPTGRVALTGLAGVGTAPGNGAIDISAAYLDATSFSGGIHVRQATGNLMLGTVDGGSGEPVHLEATGGALLDDGDGNTFVTADLLTLRAGTAIGTAAPGGQIFTFINSLDARAANGGVYVREQTGLTVDSAIADGANHDVIITTVTDMTVGSVTAPGAITLESQFGNLLDDGSAATLVTAGTDVSLKARDNIGTITDFDTFAGTPMTVSAGGAVSAKSTRSLSQINLQVLGTPLFQAGAISVGSGINRAGTIVLQSSGDLNLGNAPGVIEVGAGNSVSVGLRAGGVLTLPSSGSVTDQPADTLRLVGVTDIVDNDGTPHELSLAANNLRFQSGASVDTVLHTAVGRLDATLASGRTLTVNETDGLTIGSIDVGGGNVHIIAGGAIADDNAATVIEANSVTLAGTAIGALGNEIDLRTTSLDATATAGGIYVRENDGLQLAANATGNIDVATGGAITAGASPIAGSAVTLNAVSIGTMGARLVTDVTSLSATTTGGGIFVTEANDLALTAQAVGGQLDVELTDGSMLVAAASGDGVTLTAAGNGNSLTVNGPVNGNAGNVALTASGDGGQLSIGGSLATTADVTLTAGSPASRGAIVALAGNHIIANHLTAVAASIGGSQALNTTVATLDATATGGDLHIAETDGLDLTASAAGLLDVVSANGTLNVSAASGNGVNLSANGAAGALALNGLVNGGAGNVNLSATGAIDGGTGHQVTGSSLTATGTRVGSSQAQLNTVVSSLNATSTNGDVFVADADALTVSGAAHGGTFNVQTISGALAAGAVSGDSVTLISGGDGNGVTLNGAVAATGNVDILAGTIANRGAIASGSGGSVAGDAVTLVGASIGSSTGRLQTNAASINATGTNGGIFIDELNAVALTGHATGGALDVHAGGAVDVAAASGDSVTIATTGGIAVNGAIAAPGTITLTTDASGAIDAGAGNEIHADTLVLNAGSIGSAQSRLNTRVRELVSTSANGGTFISEVDGLKLTATATNGALDVQTGNGSLSVDAAAGDGITLVAGGGSSALTLNGSVEAGSHDITLTANGAVTAASGARIAGRTLTLRGSSLGSSGARLNTAIDSLNATAGDVYVREQDGLTLADVRATGDIEVTSIAGDITVSSVRASNNAALIATSGAIVDDGNDSTRLAAKAVTLSAGSIGAPSTLTGSTLDSTRRLDVDATTLDATASAGGIFIDELDGLASVSVTAGGGAAGDIELLTAAGDLNLQSVSASTTLLLAAGRDILALPGLGTITASRAELRAGGADPAGGRIGTLSAPLSLQLDAGNTLRLFVPQTVDPNDASRAPATLPSQGVLSTLSLFGAPSALAVQAGFGQLQGLGDSQFTSQAEGLSRTIQNRTSTVQTVLGLDWTSFDPNVSLFGTVDPSVCLPGDQRDEEQGASGC